MEPAVEVASTIGTVLVLIFMVVVGYGAYLRLSDSNRRWEERYGNRWFLTPSTCHHSYGYEHVAYRVPAQTRIQLLG